MSEINDFALLLLPIAGGLVLAILSTRLSIPAPGLFLLAAAAVPGDPLSTRTVERIAVVALVVILLNGGMDIGWSRMRGRAGMAKRRRPDFPARPRPRILSDATARPLLIVKFDLGRMRRPRPLAL